MLARWHLDGIAFPAEFPAHRERGIWFGFGEMEFLDWPGAPSMMTVWLGRAEILFVRLGFHNAPERACGHVEILRLSVLDLQRASSGEKRGSRRERIAPLLPCSRTPANARDLFTRGRWCLPAGLGWQAWWLRIAFEPATKVQQPAAEPVGAVDEADLLKSGGNDANWLMYGRTYNGHRYSSLNQINTKNVARLIPVWTFQTGVLDGFECTPLVIDGIMYVTTPWNHGYAIDCKTGSQLWHYQKSLPENLALCCDAVNRGFAAWGDRLYMATLDAHLVCLDRNTGEEVWDTPITVPGENGKEIGDIYKMAYSATVAPLVIKGKVVIGISGAEYGIRGFIDAYDAKSGKRQWRFYTVPSADDKSEHARKALATWEGNTWLTGGGSAWVTGTYDPELNTLYWGVGNPSPDFNGEVRKGDNLYTCSILALNPDDGSYKWHFQNSPHDVWDYDGVNEPVLVDITREGKPVKALVQAHRNGYFYCLNRENGEFLYGKPFCEVNWTDRTKGADGLDPKTGRPFVNPAALPTEAGVRVCPGAAGGKEWNPMAYDPSSQIRLRAGDQQLRQVHLGQGVLHQGPAVLGQFPHLDR